MITWESSNLIGNNSDFIETHRHKHTDTHTDTHTHRHTHTQRYTNGPADRQTNRRTNEKGQTHNPLKTSRGYERKGGGRKESKTVNPLETISLGYQLDSCQFVKPLPNKPWVLRVCSISLLKTLCEKEKLLVTSNFSFSHSVFYPSLRSYCHFYQI